VPEERGELSDESKASRQGNCASDVGNRFLSTRVSGVSDAIRDQHMPDEKRSTILLSQ